MGIILSVYCHTQIHMRKMKSWRGGRLSFIIFTKFYHSALNVIIKTFFVVSLQTNLSTFEKNERTFYHRFAMFYKDFYIFWFKIGKENMLTVDYSAIHYSHSVLCMNRFTTICYIILLLPRVCIKYKRDEIITYICFHGFESNHTVIWELTQRK